jgi:hypothetical protein
LPELVQEIGALAGFPAFVGLAVLSALHFSQASEVKRLREWAGRAPERSRQLAAALPGRAASGARASGQPPVVSPPVSGTPSPQRPRIGQARIGAAPAQLPSITPSRSERWYNRIGIRSLALALAGLLVLGSAAVYSVSHLSGASGAEKSGNAQANHGSGSARKPRRGRAAVQPGNVTVAVLNGTTVPGLAATLREQIGVAGFRRGIIDVYSDQQLAGSVVQYAPGYQSAAKDVSDRLGISRREPIGAESRALAADATVIVIAGADKAP